jgi:hypothetical protein
LVQKGFRILHPLLAGYIALEMNREYGEEWWSEVLSVLSDQERDLPKNGEFGELVDSLDMANCLRLFDRQWNSLFRRKLSKDYRTWATELMGVRNKSAHIGGQDFSENDTWRALDTMSRLCEVIDAEGAEEIRSIMRKSRYGSSLGSTTVSQGNVQPSKGKGEAAVLTRLSGEKLPSWREIIEPHPDVAQGKYKNAEFAANLSDVARGEGAFEYRDPVEFFARTYVTAGMSGLLEQALRRFAGKDGEPVLQLKTAFGGGKTHSLLALYHMSKGGLPIDKVPNLKPVLERAGVDTLPKVCVAVLVGTALNPSKSRLEPLLPGVKINTLWGELAAQLVIAAGKPELYDLVREADKKGVAPGSVALRELMDGCGTCLILMDELVAYAKTIYGVTGLPAGSFDNFITFIQQITEAASASKNSMVVASIPESAIEIGEGEGGKRALEAIEHTFGRQESIWKPVAANEGFEVVRRRLFLPCKDEEARNAVCTAFSKMYQENSMDFPPEAKEVEYRDRMVSCYPIHPEIFDRLYEEWATMERFQRTRGVLRLMAAVIHELWMANDASAMIMPGSITLDVPTVRDELVRYLPETWNGIMDHEVDGRNSIPYQLDKNTIRYGQKLAARRVSRTIMLGSAPTVRAQNIRGIEASRIRLGIVQPGESIADFNDALNTLRGSLAYLYTDPSGNRYWYDTRPTLRKTATDRATQMTSSDVTYEIERRLKEFRKESFAGLHVCPTTSYDVSDEQAVRLVILKTEDTHKQGKDRSDAIIRAEEILNNRGTAPRVYRNMLAFVAPDQDGLISLEKAVRELLAWQSIKTDSETLNLDAAQNTETQQNINRSNETVNLRLKETYCWLLVPYIDREVDMRELVWDVDRISGGSETVVAKAANKMLQNEQLITKWAPTLLKMELDNLLWKDENHIQIKKLWEFITTYCYLPRLANFSVLESTIQTGVNSDEFFALASSFNGERYVGLKFNEYVTSIYPTDYIVKDLVALKQINSEKTQMPQGGDRPDKPGWTQPAGTGGNDISGGQAQPSGNPNGGSNENPPVIPSNTRFFMSQKLDNTRVIRDVQKLMDEVVNLLSSADGAEVEISLEVTAQTAKGFNTNTVRAVTENCRTLKIDQSGFEE